MSDCKFCQWANEVSIDSNSEPVEYGLDYLSHKLEYTNHLLEHLIKVTGGAKAVCGVCGARSVSETEMRQHMKAHEKAVEEVVH